MIATLENVHEAALTLPSSDRREWVERLIPTISPNPELEAAHLRIVHRRIEEIESGKVQPLPGQDFFRRIEESLAVRHR